MNEVTRILNAIEQGDSHASDELLPLVYDALRRLATEKMAQESPGQTLQATALVHEVYLRLVDTEKAQHWDSRGHFFAAAAEAMRRILVEQARRRSRIKRGGKWERIDLDQIELPSGTPPDQLLLINDELERLTAEEPVAGQLVKLRYFAGLSVEEAAESLNIARSTAYEHWSYARAWLHSAVFGHSKNRLD
jgi:RNA polymerase sigma factor (TIGR02999 family)